MNGGGLNSVGAAWVLLNDTTVSDDSSMDLLAGCTGSDWFLFNEDGNGSVRDWAIDLNTLEAVYAQDIDLLS